MLFPLFYYYYNILLVQGCYDIFTNVFPPHFYLEIQLLIMENVVLKTFMVDFVTKFTYIYCSYRSMIIVTLF